MTDHTIDRNTVAQRALRHYEQALDEADGDHMDAAVLLSVKLAEAEALVSRGFARARPPVVTPALAPEAL